MELSVCLLPPNGANLFPRVALPDNRRPGLRRLPRAPAKIERDPIPRERFCGLRLESQQDHNERDSHPECEVAVLPGTVRALEECVYDTLQ